MKLVYKLLLLLDLVEFRHFMCRMAVISHLDSRDNNIVAKQIGSMLLKLLVVT